MKKYLLTLLIVGLYSCSTNACSRMSPLLFDEYKGMSKEEAAIASSDLAFHGLLIEASTELDPDSDERGNRHYNFLVLEVFKGDIKKRDIVSVTQKRGNCDFRLIFDLEYVVHLKNDVNGVNHLGLASTYILEDSVLDLRNLEDKALYDEIAVSDLASEYDVRSRFEGGEPKILVRSKQSQLKPIRAAAALLRK